MHNEVKLIALDLDGTLLDSGKVLSPENQAALARVREAGIHVVPTTGRFYGGMPQSVRALPGLRYAITINGAQVYDIHNERAIAQTEIPYRRAVELMTYLDTLPVVYDCFMDNWGWMTRSMWEKAGDYTPDEHYARMVRELRRPVEELKEFLLQRGQDVQKVQFFTTDQALRERLLERLPLDWPDIYVSSSVPNNVELNHIQANKGEALRQLAAYLGIPMEQTMAFGDGLNDVTMIQAAGIGVAMGNAHPKVLAAADAVTGDCDHSGVAQGILKFCFEANM